MMAAKTNRNVSVNKEFGSLDEALAWAVQKYDTEFARADMPKITVETVSRTLFQAPVGASRFRRAVGRDLDHASVTAQLHRGVIMELHRTAGRIQRVVDEQRRHRRHRR